MTETVGDTNTGTFSWKIVSENRIEGFWTSPRGTRLQFYLESELTSDPVNDFIPN